MCCGVPLVHPLALELLSCVVILRELPLALPTAPLFAFTIQGLKILPSPVIDFTSTIDFSSPLYD